MNRSTIRALVCASLAAAALGGCVKSGDTGDGAEPPVARAATSTRLVDRDVEAPEVFQAADQALWDGRPSLGGVWVASPDAVDPERVILRNPSNGKFVIGALFRRERLNPGPALQISSDAAAALGILAGAPTEVNVTALRREEASDLPATDATNPILDTAETVETTADPILDTAPAVETAALAAAAIDRAEGKPPAGAPLTETAAATTDADTPIVLAAVGPDEAAPLADKPKRKGWLFGRRKAVEPAPLDTAADLAPDATLPLSATTLAAAPVAVAPLAPATTPAAPAAPPSGGVIQIGIFSVEGNADRAVRMLADKGLAARRLTEVSQGKTFWRVVADPAADRAATLAKVKAAGFGDAYFARS